MVEAQALPSADQTELCDKPGFRSRPDGQRCFDWTSPKTDRPGAFMFADFDGNSLSYRLRVCSLYATKLLGSDGPVFHRESVDNVQVQLRCQHLTDGLDVSYRFEKPEKIRWG